ncbi:MAG: hypothetical protein RAP03_03675 [Candidatus Electryonea clarkiae]|nr:hypothetical protein [Candidatus Electryonea clarkiae]
MKKSMVFLLLVVMAGYLFSATVEVSKPLQLTNSEYYERGSDICYGNGYYWLVWGQAYCADGSYQNHSYNLTKTTGYGKDTSYMAAAGPGNSTISSVDGNYYEIFWKRATSIEGLVDADENLLLDTNGARLAENAYNGEAWIEFYDNKIWVLADDTDPNNDGATGDATIVCAYTTNGDSWTKISSFGGYTGTSHMDLFSFNGQFCIAKGGSPWKYKYTTTPMTNNNWSEERSIPGTGSTARAFIDEEENDFYFTDRNFTASTLSVNKLTNWASNSWAELSTGTTVDPGWDPCITKYQGNFVFISAPDPGAQYCAAPDQDFGQYISCYVGPDFTNMEPDDFTLDPCANVGESIQNDWCAFWPSSLVDVYGANPTMKTVVIYNSERVETLGAENEIGASIAGLVMGWDDLEVNHATFINTAINGCTSRLDAATSGSTINVISGTYVEDAVIPVNLTVSGNQASKIAGDVTVNNDSDASVNGFWITGTVTNSGSGDVDARFNYWGTDAGPQGGDLSGAVTYYPWYTDEAMTTLCDPLTVAIAYAGANTTLTWTNPTNHTFAVYGSTTDPYATFPGRAWTLISGVASGTPFDGDDNQFFAVVTEDWTDGASIVGHYDYPLYNGFVYIPINMDLGANFADIEVMGGVNGLDIDDTQSLSLWDATTQGWLTSVWSGTLWNHSPAGNLSLAVGDVVVYGTGTTAAGTEYLNGTLPAELVTFEFTITPTTDMNLVYLPMDMAGSTLGDVAASIGHQNANTISIWNSDTQNWVTASYISYYDAWTFSTEPVSAGQALMIGAVQNFTWPAR